MAQAQPHGGASQVHRQAVHPPAGDPSAGSSAAKHMRCAACAAVGKQPNPLQCSVQLEGAAYQMLCLRQAAGLHAPTAASLLAASA